MPKWISVKDRLPEENRDVIIGWNDITGVGWFADNNFYGKGINPKKRVTHWMPLPDGPEEK